MKFQSTVQACRKYRAMPLEIIGALPDLRAQLVYITGARHFQVRGHESRVTIAATGELIGYITEDSAQ